MKRLLTLLVAVVSATGLRAEGYQVNNLSTRQTGMGHVGTAMKLNSESIFFNPAATAFQDSKFDLSVGAAGILSYCTYTPSPTMENGFYSGNRPEWESDNKMSTPIYAYFNYKPSDRWAVGLGFFTPNGSSMNWGDDWPGANLVQEINLAAYTVQPTVSFKLCDRVSIGAGLMITWGNFDLSRSMLPVATGSATAAGGLQLAASKLQAQVDQLEQLPSTPEIAAQIAALNGYIGQANAGAGYFAANHAGEALVSARLEGSADVAVGVNAGIMWDINSEWSLGMSWRSRMNMKVGSGRAALSYVSPETQQYLTLLNALSTMAGGSEVIPGLDRGTFSAELPLPTTVTWGVSFRPAPKWEFAVDLQFPVKGLVVLGVNVPGQRVHAVARADADGRRAPDAEHFDGLDHLLHGAQLDLFFLVGQQRLVDDVQPLRGLVIADVLNVGHLPDRFIHSLPSSHIQNAVLFPGLVPQDSLIRIA